jgi:hypothetical protein
MTSVSSPTAEVRVVASGLGLMGLSGHADEGGVTQISPDGQTVETCFGPIR